MNKHCDTDSLQCLSSPPTPRHQMSLISTWGTLTPADYAGMTWKQDCKQTVLNSWIRNPKHRVLKTDFMTGDSIRLAP